MNAFVDESNRGFTSRFVRISIPLCGCFLTANNDTILLYIQFLIFLSSLNIPHLFRKYKVTKKVTSSFFPKQENLPLIHNLTHTNSFLIELNKKENRNF
ncbi:hypothetical protein BpHYR1_032746 [Brachionus plicatilis]|uniref:Uncharacterized protein n=1 Tax=Brachionus plicatilis TaxID=10195 RepID=A0A3M7QYE0_BRAPC|nr:hypothetical protein BpHYR1_032746 [Brachionus plicatilis]